jgi:hypothetical protein
MCTILVTSFNVSCLIELMHILEIYSQYNYKFGICIRILEEHCYVLEICTNIFDICYTYSHYLPTYLTYVTHTLNITLNIHNIFPTKLKAQPHIPGTVHHDYYQSFESDTDSSSSAGTNNIHIQFNIVCLFGEATT